MAIVIQVRFAVSTAETGIGTGIGIGIGVFDDGFSVSSRVLGE